MEVSAKPFATVFLSSKLNGLAFQISAAALKVATKRGCPWDALSMRVKSDANHHINVSVLTSPELSWSQPSSQRLHLSMEVSAKPFATVFLSSKLNGLAFQISAAALKVATKRGCPWDALSMRVKSDIYR